MRLKIANIRSKVTVLPFAGFLMNLFVRFCCFPLAINKKKIGIENKKLLELIKMSLLSSYHSYSINHLLCYGEMVKSFYALFVICSAHLDS